MSEERTDLMVAGDLSAEVGANALLARIRPYWQGQSLIERVRRLLPVDPSSACQRLLNAAFRDLREKIVLAGLDLAQQAASVNRLPNINKHEDILESYSNSNVLDLAYRIGIISRPEWRRLQRSYEIRRDLEHEDDQYEAQPEDCIYIFKTSIEIVLSRDPVEIIKVSDVESLIQQPETVTPSADFLGDYQRAPESRQFDISQFLVKSALDASLPDLVRQNAVETLRKLRPYIQNTVLIKLAQEMERKIKRNDTMDVAQAKVAAAGGFTSFLSQRVRRKLFEMYAERLWRIPHDWTSNHLHRDILVELEDIGGFGCCPAGNARQRILLWASLCYLGEPGNRGTWGRNREVFYSNNGAWRVAELIKAGGTQLKPELEELAENSEVKSKTANKAIARRFEALLDLADQPTSASFTNLFKP